MLLVSQGAAILALGEMLDGACLDATLEPTLHSATMDAANLAPLYQHARGELLTWLELTQPLIQQDGPHVIHVLYQSPMIVKGELNLHRFGVTREHQERALPVLAICLIFGLDEDHGIATCAQ